MGNSVMERVEEEDNLDEIAQSIFDRPVPLPEGSVQLQLEEMTSYIAEEEGVEKFIFNILCILTMKGIDILYGEKNFLDLTKEQFEILCNYVRSFGYKLVVLANETDMTPWEIGEAGGHVFRYNVWFEKIN